jgi:PiT family inorganic phosphate transporter
MLPYIVAILALTLVYGYLNGLLSSASIVATVISSRALGPRQALIMATIGVVAGPFLLGVAVANTLGHELVSEQATTATVVIAALVGAILWSSFTVWLKIPSSISQALVGALVGAVWSGYGSDAIISTGLIKALLGLFLSPVLGLLVGYWLVRFSYWASASATPHVNRWFKRGQVLAALLMALSFGANDGQKLVGVVVLGLIGTGFLESFAVPVWVVAFSAASTGLGSIVGGWRLIHTLGGKFYKIRPIHGFGAQVASGAVIFGASLLGGPVSGSQVVTSAIVGAGGADRIQKVRWSVVQNIALGWLLTIPISAFIGALAYYLIEGALS